MIETDECAGNPCVQGECVVRETLSVHWNTCTIINKLHYLSIIFFRRTILMTISVAALRVTLVVIANWKLTSVCLARVKMKEIV